MAGLNIGDVMMRVLADMTGFEADVTKKGAAAADKAGKTIGTRMGKAIGFGMSAAGAAAGTVFAVAARGAADLTDAMARFQAETGATQAELESARKSVLALSSTNLQSFDEIAQAQAALRTDMGLTQAQAEASTEAFLNYATATGQNAAEGVRAFDDILDAWNLTADDAQGLMDKLITSHQKFGGVLAEDQSTLAALAPALQAANLSVDDGIGLLGLFNDAGVDASAAVTGMTKALTKVKSPEELKALIADIANTDDAFARGQKAADLFGAKAGQKLSQALAGANIDDYTVSMNEAAGATDKAAKAIENTPFNQLKMALRGIAAPAIEAGQAFGPLLLALSQLGGGKLVAAVGSALGAIGGKLAAMVGLKLGEQVATGIAEGTAENIGAAVAKQGLAAKIASAVGIVAIPVAIAFVLSQIGQEQIEKQAKPAIAKLTEEALADGTKEGMEKARQQLLTIAHHNSGPYAEFITGQAEVLQRRIDEMNGKIVTAVDPLAGMIGNNLKEGRGVVEDGAKEMMGGVTDEVDAASSDALTAGKAIPHAIADGIIQNQSVVRDGMAALRDIMKTELTGTQQGNRLVGNLVSKDLAQGLLDGRPGVRDAANQVRSSAEEELYQFVKSGHDIGAHGMEVLNQGLKSKVPAIRAQARRTKQIIEDGVKARTKPAGQQAGRDLVSGLNSQSGAVGRAARALGIKVATYVLKGVTFKVNTDVPATVHKNPVKVSASGNDLAAYEPSIVGERRKELFVPTVPGHVYPSVESGLRAIGGTSHDPVNVQLQTYGLPMMASTPNDVAQALRRVGSLGLLRPHRRTAWEPK